VDRGSDDDVTAGQVTDDLAGDDFLAPQGLEELVLTVTLQSGQSDQLSGVHVQVDGPAVGPEPQAANAQHRRPVAGRGQPLLRTADGDQFRRAGHQADELARRPGPAAEAGDGLARAHDRDAVADLLELVHPVGNEDHADAVGGQPGDQREQPVTRDHVERGGRLVEDQDARPAQQRPHDAAGLPVAEGEVFHGCGQVGRPVEEFLQRGLGQTPLLPGRDPGPPGVVGAEPDVVQHRAGLGHQDLLEDGDDAVLLGGLGVAQLDLGPGHLDPARVGRVHPAQDLHQRALARAVLPDQGVDLARAQLERAVPERLGGPERLRHVLHPDQDVGDARRTGHVDDRGAFVRRHRDGSPAIYDFRFAEVLAGTMSAPGRPPRIDVRLSSIWSNEARTVRKGVRPARSSVGRALIAAVLPEPTMLKNLQANRLIRGETYMKR